MDVLRQPIAQELAQWPSFQAAKLSVQDIARALVRPPKRDMGDVALGCFVFAKAAGIKPNEMAAKLASAGEAGENNIKGASPGAAELVASATAAGPYVNLKLNRAAAIEQVLSAIEQSCPGDKPESWSFGAGTDGFVQMDKVTRKPKQASWTGEPERKKLVLDFSSPNIAKPLAVHHLRSTMIGYSIKKIRESQGWRVIGINHLGDWGTSFGKLIAGLKREYPALSGQLDNNLRALLDSLNVEKLNEAYRKFNEEIAGNDDLADEGKKEFAALEQAKTAPDKHTQTGDINYTIWDHARRRSLEDFERLYGHLGLRFIDWPLALMYQNIPAYDTNKDSFYCDYGLLIGESFYVGRNDRCHQVIVQARERGIAEDSDGAVVVFVNGKTPDKGGRVPAPVILQKNDGATSYHTRDMASALYRYTEFKFDEAVYVVGGEQQLHFQQMFKALEMMGYHWAENCHHVGFGLMLFRQPDGKWAKASTRKGRVVLLEDLLAEAVQAVREIIQEKNPELWGLIESGDPQYRDIPLRVGVGAVVFNDLKNGRRNDIKFDWDEILNFQGETGPYMLMQYVRMGSVSEKFAQVYPHLTWAGGDVSKLARDDEFELALLLAGFPEAMRRASAEYEPSNVAKALIEIAAQTSSWWTNTKDTRIVGDDAELSRARVRLVNAIRKVLGRGLLLLGISLVERM